MKAKRFLAILMMAAVASVAVVTSCSKEEEADARRNDLVGDYTVFVRTEVILPTSTETLGFGQATAALSVKTEGKKGLETGELSFTYTDRAGAAHAAKMSFTFASLDWAEKEANLVLPALNGYVFKIPSTEIKVDGDKAGSVVGLEVQQINGTIGKRGEGVIFKTKEGGKKSIMFTLSGRIMLNSTDTGSDVVITVMSQDLVQLQTAN